MFNWDTIKFKLQVIAIGSTLFMSIILCFAFYHFKKIDSDVSRIANKEIPISRILAKISLNQNEISSTLQNLVAFPYLKYSIEMEGQIVKAERSTREKLAEAESILELEYKNSLKERAAYLGLLTLKEEVKEQGRLLDALSEKKDAPLDRERVADLIKKIKENMNYFNEEIFLIGHTSQNDLIHDSGEVFKLLVFSFVLSILLNIFVVVFLSRKIFAPVSILMSMIKKISYGERLLFTNDEDKGLDGEIRGLALALRKMSFSIDQFEKELIEKKEMAEKAEKVMSNFISNMSHEIRTPLNAIIGIVDVVLETDMDQEQARLIRIIESAGNNLMNIVNDILDISKLESGEFNLIYENFDIRKFVGEIYDLMNVKAKGKGIEIRTSVSSEVAEIVRTDHMHLKQVLINLVGNAVKFTSQGYVEIEIKKQSQNVLRFSVNDTGIGIKESYLALLFDPYTQQESSTRKEFGGTGLGLSISQKIVTLLNSVIKVKSEINKGTSFYFDLEVEFPKVEVIEQEILKQKRPLLYNEVHQLSFRKKLLIVDDAPDNIELMCLFLQNSDFEVLSAKNGLEAVEMAKKIHFDVILMDIQMPVMDGHEAMKEIRQHEAIQGIPPAYIISLSAFSLSTEKEKARSSGCSDYITKPIKKAVLFDGLRRALSSKYAA